MMDWIGPHAFFYFLSPGADLRFILYSSPLLLLQHIASLSLFDTTRKLSTTELHVCDEWESCKETRSGTEDEFGRVMERVSEDREKKEYMKKGRCTGKRDSMRMEEK